MPAQKIHADNAARQKAYRARKEAGRKALALLVERLTWALDHGRCSKLADNLPEEPEAAALELSKRLDGIALVKFPARDIERVRPKP